MLLSYRFVCDFAWYAAIFAVVYGPGLENQSVQRVAVGLGRCRYALRCIRWCSKCQVMLCLTGRDMLLLYRLGCDCAWYAAIFVVVYGPGLVHRRVERGAFGHEWCRYVFACIRLC